MSTLIFATFYKLFNNQNKIDSHMAKDREFFKNYSPYAEPEYNRLEFTYRDKIIVIQYLRHYDFIYDKFYVSSNEELLRKVDKLINGKQRI